MSRNKKWSVRKKIRVAAAKQLHHMLAIGESRHLAKQNGTASSQIYSYSTYRTYLKAIMQFVNYCVDEHHVTSLNECRPYAATWLNDRMGKVSTMTLAKQRSALRKFYYNTDRLTVSLPTYKLEDITLNRNPNTWACFPAKRHENLVRFCLATGLRRRELHLLRGTDVMLHNGKYCIVINRGGKGGRTRFVEIMGNDDTVQVILCQMHSAGAGKVFSKVPKKTPIHHYRALYAVQVYLHYAKSYEACQKRKVWNKDRFVGRGKPPGAVESRVFRYKRQDRLGCWLDKAAMQKAALNLGHSRISVFSRSYEYPLFQKVTSTYEEQLLAQSGLPVPDLAKAGLQFRIPRNKRNTLY